MEYAKGVRRGGSWGGWIGLALSRQFFCSHVSSFRLLMRGSVGTIVQTILVDGGDFGSQYVDRQKTGERKDHSSRIRARASVRVKKKVLEAKSNTPCQV